MRPAVGMGWDRCWPWSLWQRFGEPACSSMSALHVQLRRRQIVALVKVSSTGPRQKTALVPHLSDTCQLPCIPAARLHVLSGAPCAPQIACWAFISSRGTAGHVAPAPAGAIKKWRALIGPTDSIKARGEAPQSLRARFGTDGTHNACHGSDAPDTAAEELSFFFARSTLGGLHLWIVSLM